MSNKTSVVKDPILTEPVFLTEGDQISIDVKISGVVSTLASPTNAFYKQNTGSDLSSTYLTGSTTASGLDTITTKTTTGLKAGNWVLVVSATVDGQVQNVAKIPIPIKRANEV